MMILGSLWPRVTNLQTVQLWHRCSSTLICGYDGELQCPWWTGTSQIHININIHIVQTRGVFPQLSYKEEGNIQIFGAKKTQESLSSFVMLYVTVEVLSCSFSRESNYKVTLSMSVCVVYVSDSLKSKSFESCLTIRSF